jgi:hypothetical protein
MFGQGKRCNDEKEDEKCNDPSISLYQDELEGEDYLFRTRIDDGED